MSIVYEDVYKIKSNLDLFTNPSGMPFLGQVILDLLQSRSLLAPFSTTILSISKCSSLGLDLLSISFLYPGAKREPKDIRIEKMKVFMGFYVLSVKRDKRVQSLKNIFSSSILRSKGWMNRGLKYESSHKISA